MAIANIAKKDFTYIDYLTFINVVVTKTIESGIEYRNFYSALMTANTFFGYEPKMDEDGNFNVNDVWAELRHFNGIKNNDGDTIFADFDLYRAVANSYYDIDSQLDKILPIEPYIFDEIQEIITNKLDEHYRKDPARDALANLFNSVADLVRSYEDKFKDVDINEATEQLSKLGDIINKKDFSEVASAIATTVHADNQKKKEIKITEIQKE